MTTERPRRADLADSLLRRVLADQLDPGYRQAAARRGGDSELTQRDRLEITALRPLTDPQYARPAK